MKGLIVEGRPRLCLFALRDVTPGEEVTYNYGDGDGPWRSEVTQSGMEADDNHLESECASGDDQHCTKPSQPKPACGVQVSKLLKFKRVHTGRGIFSSVHFDKGDFLLEYRGELISKHECERRQNIHHGALKVFMFEFRYNGKIFCDGLLHLKSVKEHYGSSFLPAAVKLYNQQSSE
ncbi:hypothetical protein AOLI_G00330740 [Acnodon oligacanthus]